MNARRSRLVTEVREWLTLVVAVGALLLGLVNFAQIRTEQATNEEIEVTRLMDEAWDLLAGGSPTRRISFGGHSDDPAVLEIVRRLLRDASARFPDHPLVARRWGDYYIAMGDANRALEMFDEAIRLNPGDDRAHNSRGNTLLLALNRPESALAAYERAAQIDSANSLYHVGRGNALLELRRFDDALQAFTVAADLDSEYRLAQLGIGNANLEREDFEAARAAYERTIELDEGFVAAYHGLSSALDALGLHEERDSALAMMERLSG